MHVRDGKVYVEAGETLEIVAPGLTVALDTTDVNEDTEGEVIVTVTGENNTFISGRSDYGAIVTNLHAMPDFVGRGCVKLTASLEAEEEEEDDDGWDDGYDDDESDDDDWDEEDEEDEEGDDDNGE